MNRLAEETAIVTDGAVGTSRARVLGMAEEGAKVAIFDVLDAQGQFLVSELTAIGRQAIFWAVDAADEAAQHYAIDAAAARFGGLQVIADTTRPSSVPTAT